VRRHAEIAGAGFAGLVAAVSLAQRGWTVRVHEKTPAIRAEGFAIAMQPNMLRVLEALGLRERILSGGLLIVRRETRNERNEVTMSLRGQGTHRVSRQHIVNVLAEEAAALGVAVETESPVAGAETSGTLLLADGGRAASDLVIAADGVNSAVRESVGLLSQRTVHNDGALRALISRTPDDAAEDATLGPRTCEYWSGARRVITSPCSSRELYVAMSCLADDAAGRAVPIDIAAWSRSFPHLAALFERIAAESDWSRVRWSRFETIRLKRWYAGRVAVLGDAAHAMSPNLGQGSGCAMMNALGLAAALEEAPDIPRALELWERRERPLTEHTQRWSALYGQVTNWPAQLRSLAFNALGNIGWLRRRYQRTANHIPTGYRSAKERSV
jgi:2-polyprenyl-6-methoxyphenol hydroxylase-like FAD-dependent oxidoreductase